LGIISLISAALQAFIEFSKDFKLGVAAWQKNNELKSLELRTKAIQDAKDAMTPDDYRKAVDELWKATNSI
jgi:hypothetical protein